MSEKRTGYATVTYKLRLYDRHHDWLMNTRTLYNQVVWHYYQILMNEKQLLEQSSFLALRALEEISVGTKEMKARGEEPLWKLTDVPKIPLYFRRAAINTAIGLARSYIASCEGQKITEPCRTGGEETSAGSSRNHNNTKGIPSQAAAIDCSPILYKGMYREFHEDSIQLKLYNGKKWVWVTYPYTGRKIPEEGKILSPTLKVEKKTAYLHIPVEIEVDDIRTVNHRMEKEKRICAVAFPDNDSLAVCAVMERNGRLADSYFIRGGRAREAQRRQVLERLEKSRKSRQNLKVIATRNESVIAGEAEVSRKKKEADVEKDADKQNSERENYSVKENAVLYKKLEQVNQYYAHKVSREVLNYCKKNQIKVIVVPNYENAIPFEKCRYLNTNQFHWQGRAIIRNLKYKAFKEGILVATIRPYHISDCCSECGKRIQRYNEGHKASRNYYGGQLFVCPDGHKGNAALNTAKNIGRYFLRRFQEEPFGDEKESFFKGGR